MSASTAANSRHSPSHHAASGTSATSYVSSGGANPTAVMTSSAAAAAAAAAAIEEWPPSDVLEWFAEVQQSVSVYHAWKNWLPDVTGFQHWPMSRPPPMAHGGNQVNHVSHPGPIFSPPHTPTPSSRSGPLGQDGMVGLGSMGGGPLHHGNNHQGGPPHLMSGMPTSVSSHISTTSPPLVIPQPVKGQGIPNNNNPAVSRSIKTYHCRMCDQIFESKSDLLVHSQHVHKQDPKPYKCPTCNKCFANSSYLSQHARIHSGIKPYKCQICERRFTQLCHLQQHIRTHTGEKPYKCQHPGCGKAFSQLSNLQSHSRSHMTDKPYRCNSCYKCFADEQSLREHIPKHSETKHLKTHICRICGKSYTQETYLARHMTKHNVDGQGRVPFANKSLHNSASMAGPPGLIHSDMHDVKMEGNGGLSPVGHVGSVDPNKSSAFMPLTHHQFSPSPNIMNSPVPSSLPFAPRVPNNSLNSPLSHLAPGSMPSRYFPFPDPFTPKARDPMVDRNLSMSREGMIANSLLSLQQIKNFSSSHAVFPKSEPSSPIHKEFQHKEYP